MSDKGEMRDLYSGSYAVRDAALYLRATMPARQFQELNSRHVFAWIREGLAHKYLVGRRGRDVFINFLDLISLRMVAAMRANGLTPREIRTAHHALQQMKGWAHPFAMRDFWAGRHQLLVQDNQELISALQPFQRAFEFFKEYLKPIHGITFDRLDVASSWHPHHFPHVVLDPEVQFGEPCIRGTRVPTQVLWAFYQAGDDIDTLASAYGLPKTKVESAIRWENRLQRVQRHKVRQIA